MSTRIRQQTIIFKHPFSLGGIEQTQPPGTYMVEIEEELVPDLSFPVYRRIATVIYLGRSPGSIGGYEAATIDPQDLDAAIQRDAALWGWLVAALHICWKIDRSPIVPRWVGTVVKALRNAGRFLVFRRVVIHCRRCFGAKPTGLRAVAESFGEWLAAAGVAQNDPRALEAWAEVQDDCEAGNVQAAEAKPDRAATELGAPVITEPDLAGKAEPETGKEEAE